jgi:MFS transporter, DHA1 family, inner membrane transport protein
VFFVITALGVLAITVAIMTLRKAARAKPVSLSLSGFSRGYGSVFANPRAKVCFGAVFVEGIVVFGLFPFVALLLHAAGETRATIAGAVIAGFSLGGVVYALTVPMLIARWRPDQLMIGGGVLAATALAVVSLNLAWPVQFAAFTLLGLGFYSMHASIQVTATELSSTARGAAMSLHSFFFFVGHASGPVLYGLGFVKLGSGLTLSVAALVAMAIGLVTARLLRERSGASEV